MTKVTLDTYCVFVAIIIYYYRNLFCDFFYSFYSERVNLADSFFGKHSSPTSAIHLTAERQSISIEC